MNIQEMYDAYEWLRMLDWNEQVATLTEQARAELAKMIASSKKNLLEIIDTEKNWIVKDNAEVILETIEQKIDEACTTMTDLITAAAVGTAEESIKTYGDILSAGGAAKNVRLMDGLSREQIKAVFDKQPLGGRLLGEWVERAFDSKVKQELRISLNDGLEHGASTRKIVNAMRAKLPDGYANAEREMTTLARTYIQAANTGAQELCYKANEDIIKGYRRVGALDNRTCATCAILDGKKYYGRVKRPPLPQHPRCRCIYLPITKSFEDLGLDIPEFEEEARHWAIREDGSVGVGGKKIIKSGTIKGTYKDWYNSLSDEDKAKTSIGKRGAFLSAGGKWNDLLDTRTGLAASLQTLGLSRSGARLMDVAPFTDAIRKAKLTARSNFGDYQSLGKEIMKLLPDVKNESVFKASLSRALQGAVGTNKAGAINVIDNSANAHWIIAASREYPNSWTSTAGKSKVLNAYDLSHPTANKTWQNVGRSYASGDKIYLANEERVFAVAVHEYAHYLQNQLPGLQKIFQQYHDSVTVNDKFEFLDDLRPGWGYQPNERCKKDNYIDPYIGKEYWNRGALEVIAMTYQSIFSAGKTLPEVGLIYSFEKFYNKNPELVELGIGLLFGYKP